MAKFERVEFLRASLSPDEIHLYSFKGLLYGWDQGRISSRETLTLPEDISFLGHVTNARLIIEPGKMESLSLILEKLDPTFLERIVSGTNLPYGLFTTERGGKDMMKHVADKIGHLSFDFADMDHLGVYKDSACWPVMKYNMNGKDPAFLPYTLFRITAYTGAIVGSPALDEFAEVIKNLGVKIVTYTSKAS